MTRYRPGDMWEELTYLGYHLHWTLDVLLELEHRDRARLISNVAQLNERAWDALSSRV
jgi:hypothetical protein